MLAAENEIHLPVEFLLFQLLHCLQVAALYRNFRPHGQLKLTAATRQGPVL